MKKNKIIISSLLLLTCIILSYSIPKAKYKGTGFISDLDIPVSTSNWKGKDVSEVLNINPVKPVFNFISDAVAYQYHNSSGERLIFIVLDAGNFHHPNVCFTSAGFSITEYEDTTFNIGGHTVKSHTLFTEKEGASYLTFYWIIIDKNIVHEWIEQKIKQLYFSMFNKKRVGLMVRLDIPTGKNNIEHAHQIATSFFNDLIKKLDSAKSEYIFGKY